MRHLFDILAPRLADLGAFAVEKAAGVGVGIGAKWVELLWGGG